MSPSIGLSPRDALPHCLTPAAPPRPRAGGPARRPPAVAGWFAFSRAVLRQPPAPRHAVFAGLAGSALATLTVRGTSGPPAPGPNKSIPVPLAVARMTAQGV